ncbi:P1 family peptidase [Nonomuraea sp. NPDC050556]|uniref:P1 family peptidase n=1 Tax=Nonomuraea sp. NPDC050556 TaxID=3364369 RepID=UPI0037B547F4
MGGITDVPGVRVGQVSVVRPPDVHTGVTAIVPDRLPAAAGVFAGNGYGKLIGSTQLAELGVLETPIVLTATLSAFRAADALVTWMLRRDPGLLSVNPVVGECNDGWLSDIAARPITEAHVLEALDTATAGPVAEGCVGAGTGTVAMGFKAGIGTASRTVELGTLGALVQANFGGTLRGRKSVGEQPPDDGSCMLVIATDAPLDARQLTRVARRAVFALARVGANYSNGSGDYAIAFSTTQGPPPPDDRLNPLFAATLDAVEEAVLNSLRAAVTTHGRHGRIAHAW